MLFSFFFSYKRRSDNVIPITDTQTALSHTNPLRNACMNTQTPRAAIIAVSFHINPSNNMPIKQQQQM